MALMAGFESDISSEDDSVREQGCNPPSAGGPVLRALTLLAVAGSLLLCLHAATWPRSDRLATGSPSLAYGLSAADPVPEKFMKAAGKTKSEARARQVLSVTASKQKEDEFKAASANPDAASQLPDQDTSHTVPASLVGAGPAALAGASPATLPTVGVTAAVGGPAPQAAPSGSPAGVASPLPDQDTSHTMPASLVVGGSAATAGASPATLLAGRTANVPHASPQATGAVSQSCAEGEEMLASLCYGKCSSLSKGKLEHRMTGSTCCSTELYSDCQTIPEFAAGAHPPHA